MKTWDAIVIGAGPAGSAAAYDLATNGRSVLLLDKSSFPRPKACAGGLTMKTVRALRYSIEPVTHEIVRTIFLEREGLPPLTVKSREPLCFMTVRSELDEFCLRKTTAAGAEFRKIGCITRMEQFEDHVEVAAADEIFNAKYLVGADGANSQVRRTIFPGAAPAAGFALEAQVPWTGKPFDLTFDFGAIQNGYGWIFPKRDHLNIGLGVVSGAGQALVTRAQLVAYVRKMLGTDFNGHVCGQYLHLDGWNRPAAKGRVLLAGDAAGLVDSLTAEGIYSAVISGQAAAKAIEGGLVLNRDAAEAYEHAIKPVKEDLSFSARASRAFYADTKRGLQVAAFPLVSKAVVKTYAMGMKPGSATLRLARLAAGRLSSA